MFTRGGFSIESDLLVTNTTTHYHKLHNHTSTITHSHLTYSCIALPYPCIRLCSNGSKRSSAEA